MTLVKLLNPSDYGIEEYCIVMLVIFILLVTIKHLIFHTLYYWWYRQGRLKIPMRINDLLTGKSLPERLYEFVKSKANSNSIGTIFENIELFCSEKEFALTLGRKKASILETVVSHRKPNNVLVCGSVCGYSVLKILQSSSESTHVYVIEANAENCKFIKQLCALVKVDRQVTVIHATPDDVIPNLEKDYGIHKLDFVFLTSTSLGEPSHHKVLQSLEQSGLFYKQKNGVESPKSVILADKVVHFGEAEFLKHVRLSDEYETKYFQMPLEYSPDDIFDGMEKAVYIG